MKKKKRIVLIVILALLISLVGWITWGNLHIQTTNISINNEKISDDFNDFKIAEIADLHNHDWGNKLIDRLEKEKPDIIVITGDFVDSSHTDFDVSLSFLNGVKDIAPIYYVTGNHEAWLGMEKYIILKDKMLEIGVNIMNDRCIELNKGKSKINLIGIQDPDFVERSNLGGIQESIVSTKIKEYIAPDMFNIVLCHRPEAFEAYVENNVDLAITGHAHGGQIRIPFVGGLIAPNQGLFPKYTKGVHHKNQTDMVVSRGLGNSILPVRINNNPELVIITLSNF